MKTITDDDLRPNPSTYQERVAREFQTKNGKELQEFADLEFAFDKDGITIYVVCEDGLVSINESNFIN
jgi:tRNA U54 and U55 pseudouridine synthase Pus10